MPKLFYLGLLPIIWFTYCRIRVLFQPKEYRIALARCKKKQWDEAERNLRELLDASPNYLNGIFLLIEVYARTNQFDKALSCATTLPPEFPDITKELQAWLWGLKRIYERRSDQ